MSDPNGSNFDGDDTTSDEPNFDSRHGAPDPSNIWDSDEALDSIKMEKAVHPDRTPEQMTKELLEQAGPAAAASIIHIALHSANDNTRLSAARYITDKMYDDSSATSKPAWEELVADIVSNAEILANAPQRGRDG